LNCARPPNYVDQPTPHGLINNIHIATQTTFFNGLLELLVTLRAALSPFLFGDWSFVTLGSWRLGVRSSRSVSSVANVGQRATTNQMKQNEALFCRPAHAIRPGFHGVLATSKRQNARIMSPEIGSPGATTECNRRPHNDLRWQLADAQKQNSKNPRPQQVLSDRPLPHPTKPPQRAPDPWLPTPDSRPLISRFPGNFGISPEPGCRTKCPSGVGRPGKARPAPFEGVSLDPPSKA
jgi:hypothetical protein